MGKFSFKGVIGRQQFIFSYLFSVVGMFALFMAAILLENTEYSPIGGLALIALISIVVYSFQIIVQRLRDIGLSLWFITISVIPYVNTAFIIYLMVAKTGSQAGKDD